jgi:dTDP-4-dehydrorhamnose reductase
MKEQKIAVLGVTGMLGHKMLQILEGAFPSQVYGVLRGSKDRLSSYGFVAPDRLIDQVNVESTQALLKVLNEIRPQFVINCIGITLRKAEHDSTQKNFAINGVLPQILSFWCQQHQAKFIHFSTDCVFNGARGNYTEHDLPDAEDVYGRSKYLGETPYHPSALTLRLSIVGRELFGKTELLEWFLAQKNKKISGFSEVYYSGVTTSVAAREVVKIIQKFPDLAGLYHVSSEKISKYDLLMMANQIFKANVEIQKDPSKKSDKSLNCDRYIRETRFIKPSWPEMLKELA